MSNTGVTVELEQLDLEALAAHFRIAVDDIAALVRASLEQSRELIPFQDRDSKGPALHQSHIS